MSRICFKTLLKNTSLNLQETCEILLTKFPTVTLLFSYLSVCCNYAMEHSLQCTLLISHYISFNNIPCAATYCYLCCCMRLGPPAAPCARSARRRAAAARRSSTASSPHSEVRVATGGHVPAGHGMTLTTSHRGSLRLRNVQARPHEMIRALGFARRQIVAGRVENHSLK